MRSADIESNDPATVSELGVVAFRQGEYMNACGFFYRAIRMVERLRKKGVSGLRDVIEEAGGEHQEFSEDEDYEEEEEEEFDEPLFDNWGKVIFTRKPIRILNDKFWEPTLSNLGHCLRKLAHYDDAIFVFTKALSLSNEPATRSAIAFTHHSMGEIDRAVDEYHESLAQRPDAFASEMLNRALSESISRVDEGAFCANDSLFEDFGVDGDSAGGSVGGAGRGSVSERECSKKGEMSLSMMSGGSGMSLNLDESGEGSIFLDASNGSSGADDDVDMG